jgi:TolB-like protein
MMDSVMGTFLWPFILLLSGVPSPQEITSTEAIQATTVPKTEIAPQDKSTAPATMRNETIDNKAPAEGTSAPACDELPLKIKLGLGAARTKTCAKTTGRSASESDGIALPLGSYLRIAPSEGEQLICLPAGENPVEISLQAGPPYISLAAEPCRSVPENAWTCGDPIKVACTTWVEPPPAPAIEVKPTSPNRTPLFVLDFSGQDVSPEETKILGGMVTAQLGEDRRLDVLSGQEMRRMIDLEAQKQAMGCEQDQSCLAEIADALGVRYLVSGNASRVGNLLRLNLSLLDVDAAKVVSREEVQARDLYALNRRMPLVIHNLMDGIFHHGRKFIPPPFMGREMADASSLWSAAGVAGAGAAANLLFISLPLPITWIASSYGIFAYAQAKPDEFADVEGYDENGILFSSFLAGGVISGCTGLCIGSPLAGVLGFIGSVSADVIAGFKTRWSRAALTGCMITSLGTAQNICTLPIVMYGFYYPYILFIEDELNGSQINPNLFAAAPCLIAPVFFSVQTIMTAIGYDLGIYLWEDEPLEEGPTTIGSPENGKAAAPLLGTGQTILTQPAQSY